MKKLSSLAIVTVLAIAPVALAGACSRNEADHPATQEPGPMERAGKAVDNTAHDVADDSKGAWKTTKEGAKDAWQGTKDTASGAASAVGSATERAGQKIQGKLAEGRRPKGQ